MVWRRERDSNPRYGVTAYSLSRRAPSTTRPPLLFLCSSLMPYIAHMIRGYRYHYSGTFQPCAFNHSATSPIFHYLMTLKQYRVTLTDGGVKGREFKVKAEESPMTTSGRSCSILPLLFGGVGLYYAALRCAANLVSKLTSPRGRLQISSISSTQSPYSTNL